MKFSNLYIGTLSGTSADSIDAALFDIGKKIKVVGSISKKIPQNLKSEIIKFSNSNKNLYKHPTKKLIKAIGSHGQTIQHFPEIENPYSLQIGSPKIISEKTNIKTVGNFRKANIDNGGIGAPLTPAFHKEIFFSKKSNRVIINIGGITNITRLIPRKKVIGWDSGPGNCLIDQCVQQFTARKNQFDDRGRIAEKGNIKGLEKVIESFLSQDYFLESLPKSQAIINFNFKKISKSKLKKYSFNDWASAMTEITALSIV